uniref:Uncharacterized protein n=1 Tax=Auxenochlorella protothecoides TaxID=3075 RepID=A0A1D1ZYF2_AUXPR
MPGSSCLIHPQHSCPISFRSGSSTLQVRTTSQGRWRARWFPFAAVAGSFPPWSLGPTAPQPCGRCLDDKFLQRIGALMRRLRTGTLQDWAAAPTLASVPFTLALRTSAGPSLRRSGPSLLSPSLLPLWLALLIAAIIAAILRARWKAVHSCRACKGFGIQRCKLCDGRGVVGWEGKMSHEEPCPLCLGRRFTSCPCCGGLGGARPLFAHTLRRGSHPWASLVSLTRRLRGIQPNREPQARRVSVTKVDPATVQAECKAAADKAMGESIKKLASDIITD